MGEQAGTIRNTPSPHWVCRAEEERKVHPAQAGIEQATHERLSQSRVVWCVCVWPDGCLSQLLISADQQ